MADEQSHCADCGMLALIETDTLKLQSCGHRYRQTGDSHNKHGELTHEAKPVCAADVYDLRQEIGDKSPYGEIVEFINRPRPCKSWVRWNPSLSPKEHIDMQLIQEQREWQRSRDKEIRDWQDAQAAQEHTWRVEQANQERKWRQEDRRTAMWNLVVAVVVGLIGGIATLVAARMTMPDHPAVHPGTLNPDPVLNVPADAPDL